MIAFVATASLVFAFMILRKERFMGEVVVVMPPLGSGGIPSMHYPWGNFNGGGGGSGMMMQGSANNPSMVMPDDENDEDDEDNSSASEPVVPTAVVPAAAVPVVGAAAAVVPVVGAAAAVVPVVGAAAAAAAIPVAPAAGGASVDGVTIETDWSKWKYKIVGTKLTLNGKPLNIRGINWYGFEEKQMLPELLYDYSMAELFQALAESHINAVRICMSAEYMEYFDKPDVLCGNKGVVIRNSATDHKTVEKYTVTPENTLVKADASNTNVAKYSYISEVDKDLNGKNPAYALDKFFKLAYKHNMLVMVDLHTYTATPPWNDHSIHAGLEMVVDPKNTKLADTVQPADYLAAMKVSALIKHKITDFVYPGKEPVYYSYYPYRDITQMKPIDLSSDKIATLWAKMAKFCYNYPHVFAFDLKNEPHSGITSEENLPWQGNMQDIHGANFSVNWSNWAKTCNKWYEAINAVHKDCIIVVEGLNDDPDDPKTKYKGTTCWGNGFKTMKMTDLTIPPDRLIFSPHQYGTLAEKLETTKKDWETNWGSLAKTHCVMMGEWAKSLVVKDAAAETKFMADLAAYMAEVAPDNFYFALNYTSGDTVALYQGEAKKPLVQNKEIFDLIKLVQPAPTKLTFPYI